ncbi:MAG: PAS domain-containing protein [Candidatus Latescibacteria bacterium]|nr:PAS domain-containing protein [Candidatus Latescibacterota bacterium]
MNNNLQGNKNSDRLNNPQINKNSTEYIEQELRRLKKEYTILTNRFENLIQYTQAGYFQTDKDFLLIKTNDSWLKMHKYESRGEILGRHFIETILETDVRETEALLHQVLAGGKIVRNIYRRRCKDGSAGYHALCMCSKEDSENITGVEGLILDKTDIYDSEFQKEGAYKNISGVLSQFNTMSGMLPICASCKKIRDDQGYWNGVEQYFMEHSKIEFTHSICPECERRLYPDLFANKKP